MYMTVEYRDWETKVLIDFTSQIPPSADYVIIKEDTYLVRRRWYNVTEDILTVWGVKFNKEC